DHDGLARVEIRSDLDEAERRVTRERELGIADQKVDLTRLQHGEAHLRGGAYVFALLRITEPRRGHGPAQGDVEPLPLPGGVLEGVARYAGIHAAHDLAAFLDGVERRALDLALCERGTARQTEEASESGHAGEAFCDLSYHFAPHGLCSTKPLRLFRRCGYLSASRIHAGQRTPIMSRQRARSGRYQLRLPRPSTSSGTRIRTCGERRLFKRSPIS